MNRVQAIQGNTGASYVTSLTLQWPSNITSGNFLGLFIATSNPSGSAVASVTDDQGNTWTKLNGFAGVGNISLDFWYCKNAIGGTVPHVTVNMAGGQFNTISAIGAEYTEADKTSPIDVQVDVIESTFITSHPSGNTGATSRQIEAVLAAYGYTNSGITLTETSGGYSTVINQSNATQYTGLAFADKITSNTGVQSVTFDTGSSFVEGIVYVVTVKRAVTNTKTFTADGIIITAGTTKTVTADGIIINPFLQDDFDFGATDDGKWNNYSSGHTIASTALVLELSSTLAGAYLGMVSLANYDFTGSYTFIQVVDVGNQAIPSFEFYPIEIGVGNNSVSIRITTGNIDARKKLSGVSTTVGASLPYNATTMKWVRIRESGGTTYWEYAADPTGVWTEIAHVANPITMTSCTYGILVGTWQTETLTTTAKVDNLNVIPGSLQFQWQGQTWQKRIHQGNPSNNQVWAPNNTGAPDSNGDLTMQITNPTGSQPWSTEFFSVQRGWGYGTYLITIKTEVDNIGPSNAFGDLFTFDFTTPPAYGEIDAAEIRNYAGHPNKRVLKSHVYNNSGVRQFITDDMDVDHAVVQTHRMIWTPTQIIFDSFIGSDTTGTNYFHTVHTTNLPTPNLERIHFNMWSDPSIAGYATAGGASTKFGNFSFTPLTKTKAFTVDGIVTDSSSGGGTIQGGLTVKDVMDVLPKGRLTYGSVYVTSAAPQNYVKFTDAINNEWGTLEYVGQTPTAFETQAIFWANGGADSTYIYWGCNVTPISEDFGFGGYIVAFDEFHSEIQLFFNGTKIAFTPQPFNFGGSQKYLAKVVVNGQRIQVYVNSVLYIDFTDSNRTLAGNLFGVGGRTGGINAEHRCYAFAFYPTPDVPAEAVRGTAFSGLEFGISIPGVLNQDFFTSGTPLFNYFAQKGFNSIRLPYMWERLQPTLFGALDPTYKSYIDDQITKAQAANLVVILDCHNYGKRQIYGDGGITENFTEAQPSLEYPYADYSASGNIVLRDFGLSLLGTFNNPINQNGYITTFNMKFNSKDTSFGSEGLYVRPMYKDANNYYEIGFDYVDQTYEVSKVINGVTIVLAHGSHAWVLGTTYAISIDVNQTTNGFINVTVNGTALFGNNTLATDSALQKGKVGFYALGVHVQLDTMVLNIAGDVSSGGNKQYSVGSQQVPIAALADFYGKLATAYKDNLTVYGYDIMNEPHNMPTPTTPTNYKNLNTQTTNGGLSGLQYRSIDAMKFNKDNVTGQPTDAFITSYCQFLAQNFNITHIGVAIPLSTQQDFIDAGVNLPSPRTIEQYMKTWCDAIHNAGLSVIFRGTFCGIENIYNFPTKWGTNREPESYWLNKMTAYIQNNSGIFKDGDIWAIIPEGTGNIFTDATSFIDYGGAGVQANYAQFYIDLHAQAATAFTNIGKNIKTGLTSNNWSEINTGWLPSSIYSDAHITAFDDYPHDVATLINDYNVAYAKGQNLFHQEWSDYWNNGLSQADRATFLQGIYNEMATYVAANKLIGFNYWGGWLSSSGTPEGILTNSGTDANPIWGLAANGLILQSYFAQAGTVGSTVTQMTQAAITAIRQAGDSRHWIFCETDTWAGAQSFVGQYGTAPDLFLSDPFNLLFLSCHYYFDNDHSGTYQQAFANSNNNNILGDVLPVFQWAKYKQLRMHIGEYGTPNQAAWLPCLTTFLDLCNLYDVSANQWSAGDHYTSITTLTPSFTDALQMSVVDLVRYLGSFVIPSSSVGGSTPPTTTPPTTAIGITTLSAGVYSNPATVTLTATAIAPRTVAHTYYTVDGGGQLTYTTPFTVSGSGNHTVIYWSVDDQGSIEAQHTRSFTITAPPANPPSTSVALSPSPTNGSYVDPTTITLSAVPGSGHTIANIFYQLDGGIQKTYSVPFTVVGAAVHTLVYWSVDNSGNIELSHTLTFTISALTPPIIIPPGTTVFNIPSGYALDTVLLKTPKSFSREYIYQKTEYLTLTGKSVRDLSTVKEKYILIFVNLTQAQVSAIETIIRKESAVLFTLAIGTSININTLVWPYSGSIVYDMQGSDYRAKVTLELIEVL